MIKLNAKETEIFQLLRDCVKETKLPVTLRVAGGWVRDKLLGLDSHDVDIAIDTMMGETFAEKFKEYLGRRKIPSSSCGVIHSNPDRSKHLETATLAIFGQFIDFVNLRAETYANNSRIPDSIVFGTPLEDASRRDITINSMFWNIHSEEIEDFTGLGLNDLEGGIIRTPLPPRETLLDDPLRLLRVIRFATRFQYSIVPELLETMQDPVVHASLREKVSRERIGIELEKIISDRYGLQGMFLLNQIGVFHTIFGCNEVEFPTCSYKNCEDLHQSRIFSLLSSFGKMVYYTPMWDKAQLRLALLACGLIPFAGHKYQYKKANSNSNNQGGFKDDFIVHAIIRDCLKLSNKDIMAVGSVLNHIDRMDSLLFDNEPKRDAVTIGRLLKDIGSEYRLAFYLATTRRFWLDRRNSEEEVSVREYLTILSNLLLFIDGIGLNDAWEMKPILTGQQIQTLLNIKPGQVVGRLLNDLLDWQYENPSKDSDAAIKFLRQHFYQQQQQQQFNTP